MSAALLLRFWWAPVIALLVLALFASHGRTLKTRERFATYQATTERNVREASEAARLKEKQDRAAVDEEREHARNETKALESDVVRLAGAADGLRGSLAAFQRRARNAAATSRRSTREQSAKDIALLAELFTRADSRAGELAEQAERYRIAGEGCERTYDAVAGAGSP